jgi:hypothetical protein
LALPLEGKIALVRRGTCLFVEKSRRAQALGAVGVILTNNENGPMPPLQVLPMCRIRCSSIEF